MRLVSFVLLAAGLADPPAVRDVTVPVLDRLEGAVADVSVCRIVEDACTALTTRRDGADVVFGLPKGEPAKVTVSAPGFRSADVEVAEDVTKVPTVTLRATSGLTARLGSPDAKHRLAIELRAEARVEKPTRRYQELGPFRRELEPHPQHVALRIEDLPPGEYFLRAAPPANGPGGRSIRRSSSKPKATGAARRSST